MVAIRHFLTFGAAVWLATSPAGAADAPVSPAAAPSVIPQTPEQMRTALAPICAKVPCRTESHEIRVNAEDGGAFGLNNELFPYADGDGAVIIYVGEAFEVSLDRADVSKPQFVRLVPHVNREGLTGYHAPGPNEPPPTGPAILSLELRQTEGKADMMLMVRNDTGVPLKFDALMAVPSREGVRHAHTSICAVMPGMMAFESWPHPVMMLVLTNFHRVEPGTMTCD